MRRSWLLRQYPSLLAVMILACAPGTGSATPKFSAQVEAGLGLTKAHPLPSPSTFGGMLSAGAGLSMPPGRMTFEVAWSYGDGTGTSQIPEGPFPGERSLTTFLVGVEAVNEKTARGFYAGLGAGLGHATLKDATLGPQDFPSPEWSIPDRTLTGFAFGAGVGVRSSNGPGSLGLQLAVRYHGLLDAGGIAASGMAITLGLAY